MASSSAPVQASTSRSDQNAFGGLSLINPNNESQTITPAQIQRHSIPTSVGAMYAAAYAQKCITRVYFGCSILSSATNALYYIIYITLYLYF